MMEFIRSLNKLELVLICAVAFFFVTTIIFMIVASKNRKKEDKGVSNKISLIRIEIAELAQMTNKRFDELSNKKNSLPNAEKNVEAVRISEPNPQGFIRKVK